MSERDTRSASGEEEEKVEALIAAHEARLDEIALLVARVRHEINNPLTGVLGQAQLLLREPLDERVRQRVATIEELAIRMRDIVSKLREVQRSISVNDQETQPDDSSTD
jgi:two-component system NtrC family sensor kinase